MTPTDSSRAAPRKPQVLTMTTSALAGSVVGRHSPLTQEGIHAIGIDPILRAAEGHDVKSGGS